MQQQQKKPRRRKDGTKERERITPATATPKTTRESKTRTRVRERAKKTAEQTKKKNRPMYQGLLRCQTLTPPPLTEDVYQSIDP